MRLALKVYFSVFAFYDKDKNRLQRGETRSECLRVKGSQLHFLFMFCFLDNTYFIFVKARRRENLTTLTPFN